MSPATWPPPPGGTWVIDLDGVIWLTGDPIPGGDRAVRRLRESGVRVLFATNNSAPTVQLLVERLGRAGIEAAPDDVVSSGQAAATLVPEDSKVLALTGDGAREAFAARGARFVDDGPADAVVVGWTDRFDFERLAVAADAVRAGARLIGTNDDATFPAPGRLLPGAGALLAAVATASGATPEVAGKPNPPMVALVRARAPDVAVVVGDRPSTDGRFAVALDVAFALVLSGVTQPGGPPPDPAPVVQADDIGSLVDELLDRPARP